VGLVVIILLVGLLGGLAMGAIAGARRTQSSFPAYLARTKTPNFGLLTAIDSPPLGNSPYNPAVISKLAQLPYVKNVADFTIVNPNLVVLAKTHGHTAPGQAPPTVGGSLDGFYSKTARPTVTSGRLPDPSRVDEMFMSKGAAREAGLHVGSVLPVAFFRTAQLTLPNCCNANGTGRVAPHLKVNLKLVGIGVVNPDELIEDDVDRLSNDYAILTPALIRKLIPCCAFVTETAVTIDGGDRNLGRVRTELASVIPKRGPLAGAGGDTEAISAAKVERAIEPESVALAAFGAIVALAVLFIAGQAIGRQLRLGGEERTVMRGLGATRSMTMADGLVGVIGAIVLGAVVAGVVAFAMSPFVLLGPVRAVAPIALTADWTVLAIGVLILIIGLSGIALAIAYRQTPRLNRAPRSRRARSRAGRAAADAGMPVSAVTGIRFALESGGGPRAVPARSAIFGAVLALVIVSATVTFGASLHTLVTRPALYGWNWDYEMLSGYSGQEDLPAHAVAELLDHDPQVTAWSGIYFAKAKLDGQPIPIIGADPNAAVHPPLLSGHGVTSPNQVLLGPSTLAALHKHVGDTVSADVGGPRTTTLHIVGTATMPAIGASTPHTTMGTGAWLSWHLIPLQQRNLQQSAVPGPQAILIRTRGGTSPAGLASLQRVSALLSKGPDGVTSGVTGVLRPAEIVNYRSMGTIPTVLGFALALGATAALMLTLVASVRRRRHDFALLKTFGFTRRQLASVVSWQSTVAAGIGIVIGIPLGIVAGRALWNVFAHSIYAVPHPTIPATTILAIGVGAVLLAILVALVPGLQAARTRTAVLLQGE
jgi:hypothetical protein